MENDYPGFKRFFECFSRFYYKLNVDYISEEDYYKSIIFDSDSDSDGDYQIIWSDSDDDDDGITSDDINNILRGYEDSESDSDSD